MLNLMRGFIKTKRNNCIPFQASFFWYENKTFSGSMHLFVVCDVEKLYKGEAHLKSVMLCVVEMTHPLLTRNSCNFLKIVFID